MTYRLVSEYGLLSDYSPEQLVFAQSTPIVFTTKTQAEEIKFKISISFGVVLIVEANS